MSRLSALQVTNRITPVFQQYGYDGASLSEFSKATGLSRGSLYHHFPDGKEQMARAVLARTGAILSRLVMAPLMRPDLADKKITAMFEGVKDFYQGDPPVCLMNSLTLGAGRDLFGDEVNAAVKAWVNALANTLMQASLPQTEAENLAISIIERIQGALIFSRVCGNRHDFETRIDYLSKEILLQLPKIDEIT